MTTFKKIWNIVSTVLVVLVVLCAVFLMGSRIIGYQAYTVLTGSMEPIYKPGDLIYVKQVYSKDIAGISDLNQRNIARQEKVQAVQKWVDDGTLQVGDAITFMKNETTVATHKIVRIDEENNCFYTKGEANKIEDAAPVLYENLIGEVQFCVPKLGYVSDFIQSSRGMYITIAVFVVLLAIVFLPDMIGKKKKAEEAQAEAAAAQAGLSEATEENERLKAEVEQLRAEMAEKDSDSAE